MITNGVQPAKIKRAVRIQIMEMINLKELFRLYGKRAKDTIEALKENKSILWERKDVEGRTVLIANIDE